MSARSGTLRNVPDIEALSRLSHGSIALSFIRFMDEWITSSFLLFSRTWMMSPAWSRKDGMSTGWLLTRKWPCVTSWRAAFRDGAKPEPVDDVVEPSLEHLHERLARAARSGFSAFSK